MKLISLNIWGGRKFKSLIKYIKSKKKDTDIFCFQEVYDTSTNRKIVEKKYRADILKQLSNKLKEFDAFFVSNISNFSFTNSINFNLNWGIVIFVRKNISVIKVKTEYIHGYINSELKKNMPKPRKVQLMTINKNGKKYTFIQFHGLWVKGKKIDTAERLLQSRKIRRIIDKVHGKKIICGDFNLLPGTKSLSILEKDFLNLIKNHNISTTRSKFYKRLDKYADYILISKDINVQNFNVPKVNISDHLPMELIFD